MIAAKPANPEAERFAGTEWVLDVPATAPYRQHMATASNYRAHTIHAGVYPVSLVNGDYTVWNQDLATATPGFIANTGPYYGSVDADATHTGTYYVDRLFTASRAYKERHNEPTTVSTHTYSYKISDGAPGPFGGTFLRVK